MPPYTHTHTTQETSLSPKQQNSCHHSMDNLLVMMLWLWNPRCALKRTFVPSLPSSPNRAQKWQLWMLRSGQYNVSEVTNTREGGVGCWKGEGGSERARSQCDGRCGIRGDANTTTNTRLKHQSRRKKKQRWKHPPPHWLTDLTAGGWVSSFIHPSFITLP